MSATSPNPTPFKTTQPGGTGDHTPHSKLAFGTGDGSSGTVVEVNDGADASRLPVGGSSIGNPTDLSSVNSLIGLAKRILSVLPAALTPGGWFPVEIKVDASGVPAGQAAMAGSIPVVQPNDFGALPHSLIAAATVNATLVKNTAGTLLGGYVHNRVTAERFVKFYDKATAPVAGDTPIHRMALAAGVTLSVADLVGAHGGKFTAGLGYRTTTGLADSDNTAVAANDLVINLSYK